MCQEINLRQFEWSKFYQTSFSYQQKTTIKTNRGLEIVYKASQKIFFDPVHVYIIYFSFQMISKGLRNMLLGLKPRIHFTIALCALRLVKVSNKNIKSKNIFYMKVLVEI